MAAIAAQAQQADTLAPGTPIVRLVATPVPGDSTVRSIRIYGGITAVHPLFTRVAGVQVTPYSGAPGAGAVVRIRGAASLDNHVQPLYVVDGVPVFQYRFNTFSEVSGFNPPPINPDASTNPLLSIAPEDIEQVEILKGAFDTGQYGFLGQNGVVRITTRRGAAGQPLQVQYTGWGGVQTARNRYQLLGAREAAELANEAARNNGYAPDFTPAEIASFGAGTDWQAEVLRAAAIQEHHLNLQGSNAYGTRYYAGLDYLNQQGIVLSSDLHRYGLRLNLDQNIGQHLRLSAGLNYNQVEEHRPTANALPLALRLLPTVPVYDATGDYATDYGNPNPVQVANQNLSNTRNRRLLAHGELNYEFLPGLRLNLRASLERDSLVARDYLGPNNYYQRVGGYEGSTRRAFHQQTILNPALRYARNLGLRHAITASAEANSWRNEWAETFRTYQPKGAPRGAQFVYQGGGGSTFTQQYNLFGYQLTAGYVYDHRYALQGSLRADNSTHAPSAEAREWLPAAQATWHAGEEKWLKGQGPISTFDLLAGWGQTSNRGNYAGDHGLNFRGGATGANSYFLFLDELTAQVDAGLRLGLAHDRLFFTASAYRRDTRARLGYPGQQLPAVYVRNRGLELTLAGTWQAGRLHGSTGLTASFNRNRYDQPTDTGIRFYVLGRNFAYTSGEPLGSFYGNRFLGLDATGNPLFDASNGGNLPSPQILGSGVPRQLLGLTQQLTYGRFDLQLQLDGMFSYDMFDANLQVLDVPRGGFNATTRVRDRWTPTNTNTDVPRAGTTTGSLTNGVSSYTLQSGNHLRLSNVVVSAEVWRKAPHAVSVFLTGTNLLVLTAYRGFDPNVSAAEADPRQAGLDLAAYPVARTVALGVRATL
ncbi:TonB-dependent receptor [Hymenobacter glaciei]|uniref:TonB-dependent receptor n=2 Tax=Hymenobacter glaciei TaxID=877209 RepID=A0ABP7UIV4_9BACT